MKRVEFLMFVPFFLGGCTAVLKNSGYSSKDLVSDQECRGFSYTLDSVAYWKRFDMMGPLIPLFPSWNGSKNYGLTLKVNADSELDGTYCPVLIINGVNLQYLSFDFQRKRCAYHLEEVEGEDAIELEVKHPECETKKIILEKYEKWDYVPPFMVTV